MWNDYVRWIVFIFWRAVNFLVRREQGTNAGFSGIGARGEFCSRLRMVGVCEAIITASKSRQPGSSYLKRIFTKGLQPHFNHCFTHFVVGFCHFNFRTSILVVLCHMPSLVGQDLVIGFAPCGKHLPKCKQDCKCYCPPR